MSEAIGTLADSFLEDLDDLENDDDGDDADVRKDNGKQFLDDLADLDDNDDDDDEAMDTFNEDDINISHSQTLDDKLVNIAVAKAANAIGSLRKMKNYKRILDEVKEALKRESSSMIGQENDPEYNLILSCNTLIQQIDEEIASTHRYVVNIYSKKFPELENLIPNIMDYIRTVQRIGNELDMTLVEFSDILPSASVMVVSVSGSTTSGVALGEKDLSNCLSACSEIMALHEDKVLILRFVESRMSALAPNLCALIGSRIAAQLIGIAGGIVALSKIPSCNVQVIGQEKKHLAGFAKIAAMPHTGILYYCDLIQSSPPFIRRKLLKVVAGKVTILARVDSYKNPNQKVNAEEGIKMRQQLQDKIDKLLEPPKARTKKALPIPEEKKRNRRGGKRVRKMKERYRVTELRQQQNRLGFSPEGGEYSDSAMGITNNMIGHKDTGKIRATLKKESQLKKMKKVASVGMTSGATNGLSSSLVFTPVQGLELVNPNAAMEKVKEANAKWFNSQSGFLSAAPK